MAYPAQIDELTLGKQALTVVEETGWEYWSLRVVAKHLGVTANALYRYVPDRAGLAAAMGQVATEEFHQFIKARVESKPELDAVQQVIEIGLGYIEFAERRPHAYSAFFHGKPHPADPAIQVWLDFWAWLHQRIAKAVPGGEDAAAFALWAYLHGRVGLANGPAQLAPAHAGLREAMSVIILGFQSSVPVPSPLPEHVRRVTA